MGVADQLGAPSINYVVDGLFSLIRVWRKHATAAAPVTPSNVYAVQSHTIDAPAPRISRETFQYGGGGEGLDIKRDYRFNGSLQMLAGYVPTFISELLGNTFTDTGESVPFYMPTYPVFNAEMVCRREDNTTHLLSVVLQDCILLPFAFSGGQEDTVIDVPFMSKHEPFILPPGLEMVMDKFTGDGSTAIFTLSGGTPVTIAETDDEERFDWIFDDIPYVTHYASATTKPGVRQKSGITHATGTLHYATPPGSGVIIETFYAVKTA